MRMIRLGNYPGQEDGNGGFSSQNVASDEKEEKTRVAACVAQV